MKPGGRFYMVANRHLPYESILEKYYSKVSVLALQDGFKVFQAIK
jgi:16S rRNA (guanine1207-N2)-methyltransferase